MDGESIYRYTKRVSTGEIEKKIAYTKISPRTRCYRDIHYATDNVYSLAERKFITYHPGLHCLKECWLVKKTELDHIAAY